MPDTFALAGVREYLHSTSLNYIGSNNMKIILNKSDNTVTHDINKIKSQFSSLFFSVIRRGYLSFTFQECTFLSHSKSAKHLSVTLPTLFCHYGFLLLHSLSGKIKVVTHKGICSYLKTPLGNGILPKELNRQACQ